MNTKKEPWDDSLLNRYDVMFTNDVMKCKLIYLVKAGVSTRQHYVTVSELFHVHHEVYLSIRREGLDTMLKRVLTKYKKVTRYDIEPERYQNGHFCNTYDSLKS